MPDIFSEPPRIYIERSSGTSRKKAPAASREKTPVSNKAKNGTNEGRTPTAGDETSPFSKKDHTYSATKRKERTSPRNAERRSNGRDPSSDTEMDAEEDATVDITERTITIPYNRPTRVRKIPARFITGDRDNVSEPPASGRSNLSKRIEESTADKFVASPDRKRTRSGGSVSSPKETASPDRKLGSKNSASPAAKEVARLKNLLEIERAKNRRLQECLSKKSTRKKKT